MAVTVPLLDLSDLQPSSLILGALAGAVVAIGLLYGTGVLGLAIRVTTLIINTSIRRGFLLWERYFSWAPWPIFLALVLGMLALGIRLADTLPWLTALVALVPLLMGVAACLAYMFIGRERYEVERGYKSVHNPYKGQELAYHLLRYGHRVGLPLLASAAIGTIGGFALLNQGLYASVGQSWFQVNGAGSGFADFLAYALIHLYGLVDLLDLAASRHLLQIPHISAAAWPATLLVTAFKVFFTFVLLQQLCASVRAGWMLGETIDDFWSPHEPIHLRARGALPLLGRLAIRPLLASLRVRDTLTKEQRDQMPLLLADIGPSIVPVVTAHLRDSHEDVRAVAVAALGRLQAVETVPLLLLLRDDPSAMVRQNLVEALGQLATFVPGNQTRQRLLTLKRPGPRHHLWLVLWRWWCRKRQIPDLIPQAVACLRAKLTDVSPGVRVRAAAALAQIGPGAVEAAPELRTLLQGADETARCQAAEALGQIGAADDATLAALVELLTDASTPVRKSAAQALGFWKEAAAPALPALLQALHDREETVREAAAQAMSQIGTLPAAALDSLVDGLASSDNLVRATTARMLGTIGTAAAQAAPALVEAMEDHNDAVRAEVVEALGKLGPAAADVAVPHIARALRDPDSWVSALAAEALGAMGESAEEALPALVRSLRHVQAQVRANAAEALGKMGPVATSAEAALMSATRDEDSQVRCEALHALGSIGKPLQKSDEILLAALADAAPEVRAAAAEMAGRWGEIPQAAQDDLVRLLDDANDSVKVQAARVLPKLVGAKADVIAGLCRRLLQDDNAWVQGQAAEALGQLGPPAAAAGPALLRTAQTAEASVRELALRALARIQPPEAAAAFQAGLKDARAEIRIIASAGWRRAAEIPEEAIDSLVEALRDPEEAIRANAAYALGRLESLPPTALPLLIECTHHASDMLRLHAAMALQAAPAQETASALTHLLDDANPRLRLLAARPLLAVNPGHAQAVAVVAEALANTALNCRKAALRLLEALGPGARLWLDDLRAQADREETAEIRDGMRRLIAVLEKVEGEPAAALQPLPVPELPAALV